MRRDGLGLALAAVVLLGGWGPGDAVSLRRTLPGRSPERRGSTARRSPWPGSAGAWSSWSSGLTADTTART